MPASKEDQGKAIPLSNAEIKLIALGVRFAGEGGKMDYEKIAQYGGYTKGSAQVLYRKAHRKLLEAFPVSDEAGGENNNTSETSPSTPKPKGGRAAGAGAGGGAKKRKAAATAVAEDADSETTVVAAGGFEPGTPVADGSSGGDGEARTPTKTPAKRQRKSPVKKTAAAIASELVKKEEQDSDDQKDIIKTELLDGVFTTPGL